MTEFRSFDLFPFFSIITTFTVAIALMAKLLFNKTLGSHMTKMRAYFPVIKQISKHTPGNLPVTLRQKNFFHLHLFLLDFRNFKTAFLGGLLFIHTAITLLNQ